MKTLIFALLTSILIFGCATTRAPFVEITDIPEGKGVVYLYMPSGGNVAQATPVYVDNAEGMGMQFSSGLYRGYHVAYVAPLGENMFRFGKNGTKAAASVVVEQGQSYFIRMKSTKFFWTFNFKPEVIDPTVGFYEIVKTQPKLLESVY